MKILFDCTGFAPFGLDDVMERPLGGTEHSVCYLVKGLRSLGHSVDYICGGEDWRWDKQVDVIVHVSVIGPALVGRDTKHVFWSHHPQLLSPAACYDEMDKIICLAEFHRATLCGLLDQIERPFPMDSKVVVIGHGYDPAYYFSAPTEDRVLGGVLVYHSFPNRGLGVLLDWASDILKIDPRLTICAYTGQEIYWRGRTGLGDEKLSTHSSLSLGRVLCNGPIPFPELAHILNNAFLHVYPCVKSDEAFPAAVWMSQAAGLPVLTTAWGGLVEVAAGQMLVYPKGGNVRDLFVKQYFLEHIEMLVKYSDLWEMYSQRGRRHVKGRTWGAMAKEWEDLLAEVVYG